MKKLFLVHTPFQLLSVLNIIAEKFESNQCEIIFLHKNLEKYADSVDKKIKIYFFREIYENIKFKNDILNRISLISYIFKVKRCLKKRIDNKICYNELFIPSKHISCNIIYNYLKKFNRITLNIYDEGIGTYLENYFIGEGNVMYRILNKVFLEKFAWDERKKLYLYRPDLFDKKELTFEIEKIYYNKENYKKFEKLIDSEEKKKYIEAKIIILNQGNIFKEVENTNLLVEKFRKFLLRSQIIVKLHPRLGLSSSQEKITKSKLSIPFEMIYPDLEIENKIVVSMYSTGCLTPYILSDKNPYIIFLGNLNNNGNCDNIFNSKFFKRIVDSYPKNKIFFPKTEEELDEIVNLLKIRM